MSSAIKRILLLLAVGVIFFAVFLGGQASIRGFWSNDDPYYHARHSALINETNNLALAEPWLGMHFFSYIPNDPWWGYHLAMAGFIHWFGIVWGSKILTALLGALIFAVFYFILAVYKTPQPWLWTILFLGSSREFISRLALERPHLLAPLVLLAAWFLASRKKYFYLAALCLVYTLAYHLSPLVMVVVGVELVVDFFQNRRLDLKLLRASLGGILAGLIIHPQTLNYIYIMYVEIWRVLSLRFQGIDLNIGGEVVTLPFGEFLLANALPLLFCLVGLALVLVCRPTWPSKIKSRLYSLAALSGLWFVVALVVPRGIEYWLPFSWLFCALVFGALGQSQEGKKIKDLWQMFASSQALNLLFYGVLAILLAVNFMAFGLAVKEQNKDSFVQQIKEAAEWLKSNTPDKSIVFYDNWGYWPLMFYYNQNSRYLIGMDPTFAYEYNHELYWTWRNISGNGLVCDQSDGCPRSSPRQAVAGVADAIRNQFQSEYILAKNDAQSRFYKVLAVRKQDFEKVFGNDGFLIYQLKRPE